MRLRSSIPHPAPVPDGPPALALVADDAGLVARIRQGDARALETVFRTYGPGLVVYATRCLGSPDAADDLVQDLFLALWQGRERLDVRESLAVYLYRAARNRVLNVHRHERLIQRTSGVLIRELAAEAGDDPTAHTDLVEGEIAAALGRVMAALPPRSREVFLLNRERGLSYSEIAGALGLSIKTVESHMARALRGLRTHLRSLIG